MLKKVALLKPDKVLDVGCGCGSFTAKLSSYCGNITAIDSSLELIDRCKRENHQPNITYRCMDGTNIQYPDKSFDLVMERDTLHHIREWEKALDEMIRVSSKFILVEEPIDDPRSEEKKNTMRVQEFLLELQNEVGFSHYKHIVSDLLTGFFQKRNVSIETHIIISENLIDFDEYFSSFGNFAERSKRKAYWYDRLERLRRELNGKMLCEEDTIIIIAVKF
jgi:SAM-dependent methyltransferase